MEIHKKYNYSMNYLNNYSKLYHKFYMYYHLNQPNIQYYILINRKTITNIYYFGNLCRNLVIKKYITNRQNHNFCIIQLMYLDTFHLCIKSHIIHYINIFLLHKKYNLFPDFQCILRNQNCIQNIDCLILANNILKDKKLGIN